MSSCYLELNKMTEYTLKPVLYYAPGHTKYHEVRCSQIWLQGLKGQSTAAVGCRVSPVAILDQALCKLTGCQGEAKQGLVIKTQNGQGQEKPMLAMFYATVSGVCKSRSQQSSASWDWSS